MTTEIAALRAEARKTIERLCPEVRGIVATDLVDGREVATYETRPINLEDCLFAVKRADDRSVRLPVAWVFVLYRLWEYGKSYDEQPESFINILSIYLGL